MKKLFSTLLIAAIGCTYVSSAAAQSIGDGSAQQNTSITIPSIKIVRATGSVSFGSDDIDPSAFNNQGTLTITKTNETQLVTIHNQGSSQKVTVEWSSGAPSGFGTGSGDHKLAVQADDNGYTDVVTSAANDVVTGLDAGANIFDIDYQLTVNAQAGQVSNATNSLTFTLTADS